MSEPIAYDRMRRLLGLPDLPVGPPERWAVRKIRAGERSGLWGVWSCPAAETANHALVEAFRTWSDAIAWVRRALDERGGGTSPTDWPSAGERGRAGDEVIAQA